jgi:hypothetical protein
MLGTVIVTGTDNDYAPVLATCPCGNANRGQDRKLEEIVMVRNGSSHHLLTYLEMRACNDAANLAMGPGNDASASTDSVSQPGPKEVSTASQSAGSKGSTETVL